MAENLNLKHQIHVPFAENGNKYDIPDTSSDGSVNMDTGLGVRYETAPAKGGIYAKPELMNSIFYPLYAAVKELQDIAITAGFPINMQNAINILPVANGGTGNNDGNNFQNLYNLNTIIDIPMTLQEFCDKISQNNTATVSGAVYLSNVVNNITDLPNKITSGILYYSFALNRRDLRLTCPFSNGGEYWYVDNNQNSITGSNMIKVRELNGVMPINVGGTNATNAEDARKNLLSYSQPRLPSNVDLNNTDLFLKNRRHSYRNGDNNTNRPHVVNTGEIETYLDSTYKRGWQKFYTAGVDVEGWLAVWARKYSNNAWQAWKQLRDKDGNVPVGAGGTGNTYGKAGLTGYQHIPTFCNIPNGVYTTQQVMDYLNNSENFGKTQGTVLFRFIWSSHATEPFTISDLPFNPTVIKVEKIDNNTTYLTGYPAYNNYATAIGRCSGGTFQGWKIINNNISGDNVLADGVSIKNGASYNTCQNRGAYFYYSTVDQTGSLNGQNKLTEPIYVISFANQALNSFVELGIGVNTKSLYVRTDFKSNTQYASWRKI